MMLPQHIVTTLAQKQNATLVQFVMKGLNVFVINETH